MIKIALYKRRKGWYNYAIYYWQFLTNARAYRKYMHVELVVDGIWYTASFGGVRKREIKGNPDHWDYKELEASMVQKQLIHEWFEERIGLPYDICGVACSQILPLDIGHPKKWFCSEAVYAALVYAGVIPRDKHAQWYSPARLTKYIMFL